MKHGQVKSWDSTRGFGFIVSDEDEDLFVHISDLDISIKDKKLKAGQKVTYDIRSDVKGDRAINVRVIK